MVIHWFNKFQEMANKLPKVKNLYMHRISLQTVMQCPMVPTVRQIWSLSECIHGHWLSFDDCRSKMSAVCFPFPHFPFLISSFLLLEWPGFSMGYIRLGTRWTPPDPLSHTCGEGLGTRLESTDFLIKILSMPVLSVSLWRMHWPIGPCVIKVFMQGRSRLINSHTNACGVHIMVLY